MVLGGTDGDGRKLILDATVVDSETSEDAVRGLLAASPLERGVGRGSTAR